MVGLEGEPLPVALVLEQDLEYRICYDSKARAWVVLVRS